MAEAQNETAAAERTIEKPPKLCWEERQPIFKFLPTSELFRFASNSVNVLGDYWSQDAREVIAKRGPFSIGISSPWHPAIDAFEEDEPEDPLFLFQFVLRDRARDSVAIVKHPRLFGDSPLCALTEGLDLPLRWYPEESILRAICGSELLAALACSLKSLTLLVNSYLAESAELGSELVLDFAVLSEDLKEVIRKLQSFRLLGRPLIELSRMDRLVAFVSGMRSVMQLVVPFEVFNAAMPAMVPLPHPYAHADMPHDAGEVLEGLQCLNVSQSDPLQTDLSTYGILQFISARCGQLRELFLLVGCDISYYLAAFRSLPNLAKLGLSLWHADANQLNVSQFESAVTSVKELHVFGHGHQCAPEGDKVTAIVAIFPSVSALTLQAGIRSDLAVLRVVTKICSDRILPRLLSLKCFAYGRQCNCSLTDFMQFIENPHLPRILDLSQMHLYFKEHEPLFLARVYEALRKNSVTLLLLKGQDHVAGLPKLHEAIAAESGSPAKRGKVTAWQDKQFGPPPNDPWQFAAEAATSDVTDVKVCGTKLSGPARGEEFTVRLFHPAKPWIDIFN